MPIEAPGIRLSPLDTERFGIVTARVDAVEAAQLPGVLDFCRTNAVELLIARCAVGDYLTTHALGNGGFALMDTLVYYERDLIQNPLLKSAPEDFRLLQLDDITQVEAIAASCFHDYGGHYHADPRLDRDACTNVYVSWARSCCDQTDGESFVLVCADGKRTVAFSAFRRNPIGEGELVLGAVLPEARGAGLYRRMTIDGMRRLQGLGVPRFVTSTQINNWRAEHAWIGAGLLPSRAFYTFHRWF